MSNNQSYNGHSSISATAGVVVREANETDAAALERLAQLDSSRMPAAPMLVAQTDRGVSAAISLADGAVIADPFIQTDDLVTMLRARAGHPAVAPGPRVHLGRMVIRRSPRRPRPSAPSVPGLPGLP